MSKAKKEEESATTQVRVTLDNRVIEHFEQRAEAMGVTVQVYLRIIIGERYEKDRKG